MSNPTTQFLTGGIDLSSIFQPLSLGTAYPTATGYKIPNGQDLNQIFAAYPGSGTKANATGFQVNGNDLCNIFAKHSTQLITYTNQNAYMNITSYYSNNYYVYNFKNIGNITSSTINWLTATCNIAFLSSGYVDIILVGGGGAGGYGEGTSSSGIQRAGGGGGGGGKFIHQAGISVQAGVTYSLSVGSGGNTYQNSYQNGESTNFAGGLLNFIANGGNHGGNAQQGTISGGSGNGNGGNGGNPTPSNGFNGTQYTTDYGEIINTGGGGGGGYGPNNTNGTGDGGGAVNYVGGLAGTINVNKNVVGTGYGAGGGGGGGWNPPSGSSGGGASGGAGGNGIVIIYFKV